MPGETIEGYSLLVLSLLVLAIGPALHQLARATCKPLASFVRMGPRASVSQIASDGEADHDQEHHHGEGACWAAETAGASDHAHHTHND